MSWESALALSLAIFVLGATPGPAVFAIVSRALAHGFRSTLVFIAGVVAGDVVYLILAVLGLSVVASRYAPVFEGLKIASGLYLVYLGVQTWRAAKGDPSLAPGGRCKRGRSFLGGLGLTLGNPKAVVFYVAFLPAFLDLNSLNLSGLAVASMVVSVTLFCVLAGYALMASRARSFFRARRAMGNLHRGAGALMIGAGGVVAAS